MWRRKPSPSSPYWYVYIKVQNISFTNNNHSHNYRFYQFFQESSKGNMMRSHQDHCIWTWTPRKNLNMTFGFTTICLREGCIVELQIKDSLHLLALYCFCVLSYCTQREDSLSRVYIEVGIRLKYHSSGL